jgi:uncharacterized membrane protein YgcG
MRRVWFAGVPTALLLFAAAIPSIGRAALTTESIADFQVSATVAADRTVTITERITYDFPSPRHGIYREIPIRYDRNGGFYRLRLHVDDVKMDGKEEPYSVKEASDTLTIKIGEADTYITGRHVYLITYHTDRALNFFPSTVSEQRESNGHDEAELYWNVTGNEWNVPIEKASITIKGPEGFVASGAQAVCYVGSYGSTDEDCALRTSDENVTIVSKRSLDPREGLTVAVRFPAGMIAPPTPFDVVRQFLFDNGILFLPVVVFIAMLAMWYSRGRDPKGRGTVVPQYEAPRSLTPIEMQALLRQSVDPRGITATIIDLARRGYLRIEFGESKGFFSTSQTFTFVCVKEADASLAPFEASVYEGMFDAPGDRVTLEDLKGSFYKVVNSTKTAAMHALVEKKLFAGDPMKVRGLYTGLGIACIVVPLWAFGGVFQAVTIGALVATGIVVMAVGWFMPKKTKEGAVVLEEIEGFKWFLSVTEKDRLAFSDAPAMKPEQFAAFLPAAIAFGVEEQWAEQFKGIDIPPPSWAAGTALHHWSALSLVHSMQGMHRAAAASAYAKPSSAGSGGSGFSGGGSGGGFGGGGGGSW